MKIRKQMKKGIITIALVICFSMIAPGPGAGVFAATGEDADARLASSPVSLQAGSDRTPLGREWRKSFNKNGYLYSNMAQLANGNIVAVGEAHVPKGSASSRFAVLCFDPNGKQLWERLYNKDAAESTSASFFTSVVAAQDGGFVAVGATSAEKGELASEAGVLIRFDDQGDVKWIRSFKNREFVRVVSSGDGGFAAIGSIPQPKAKADATFLVRVDAGGTALWEKVFPQTNRGGYTDLILCADGGFAALGETNPKDISKTYAFLARFDKDGNNKWIKTYKKAGHLRLTSLVQLSDGRFAAAGAASRTFLRDGVLAKFDDAGNFMWRKYYGGSFDDQFFTLTKTKDGNLMVFGAANSADGALRGSFPTVVKGKKSGSGTSTGYFPKASVTKLATSGKTIWTTTMDYSCYEDANAIPLKEGGYIFLETLILSSDEWAIYPGGISKIPEDLPQVGSIKTYTYTGKPIKPLPVVRYKGTTLKRNLDYTLTWKNNKKTGFASITITGKGSISGKRIIYFQIKPKKISGATIKTGTKQITVSWKKAPAGTVQGYQIRYRTKGSAKWRYEGTEGASKNTLTIKNLKSGSTCEVQVCGVRDIGNSSMLQILGDWSAKKTSGKIK